MERRPDDDEHQADDDQADAGEAGERAATPDELERVEPDEHRDEPAAVDDPTP